MSNSQPTLRRRTTIGHGICTVAFVFLFALTLVLPDWIEALTGLDPDRDGGWLETVVTLAFGLAAATSAVTTYVHWRRVHARTTN